MGCNGTCARAHKHTHTASVSHERLGRLLSFFGSWLESQQLLGFSPNMGRGLFFSRAHVHTPVLYLGNHQCDYVQISYRYGYRVGSLVHRCSGSGRCSGRGSSSGRGSCSLVVEYW